MQKDHWSTLTSQCGKCYEVSCDNRFNNGGVKCVGGPYKIKVADKQMETTVHPPEDMVRTFDITDTLYNTMTGGGGCNGSVGITYKEVSC